MSNTEGGFFTLLITHVCFFCSHFPEFTVVGSTGHSSLLTLWFPVVPNLTPAWLGFPLF